MYDLNSMSIGFPMLQQKLNFGLSQVVMWSGCKDSQTSADTSVAGQATGAMSWALVSVVCHSDERM